MKVYLIMNGEGFFKVGMTKHAVTERIRQLQIGSATELKYVSECHVRYPSKVETALHRQYMQYHMIGEWFDLPQEAVDNFADAATRCDNMIQYLVDSGNPFI